MADRRGQKRGPYKRYHTDPSIPIPRTTEWRLRKNRFCAENEQGPIPFVELTEPDDEISENGEINVNLEPMDDTSLGTDDRPLPQPNQPLLIDKDVDQNCLWREPFYQGSSLSIMEAALLVMSFVTSFSLTKNALQSLLNILILFLPDGCKLPRTAYLLKKLLPNCQGIMQFYCPLCEKILEQEDNQENSEPEIVLQELFCPCSDGVLYSRKDLIKQGSYFLTFSIENQIKKLLEDTSLGKYIYTDNTEGEARQYLSDIKDGKLFQTFAGGKLLNKYALSLIMNTDGAPLFKSSKKSLWPVQFYLNNLPLNLRKRYVILGSLWAGKGKPKVETIIRNSVTEIRKLSNTGFQWRLNNSIFTSTVDVIGCCVDSVARAMVQNLEQFNGLFGCPWCLHSGTQVRKDDGTVRVYEYRETQTRRTHVQTLEHAKKAYELGYTFFGVKGATILSEFPHFDVINCVNFDSMHCIDLGVMRQLANLWFESCNFQSSWYIGGPRTKKRIDRRLSVIRPPSNVIRLPRSIEERATWKSSEWRNFLLYYGPQILQNILPTVYYNNFLLLSEATYLLNQSKISYEDLDVARQRINFFLKQFEELYGTEHMSFNIHQLSHACDSVEHWGPLWAYSAYGFEDHNGRLLKMFNGTQMVDMQIAKNFLTLQHLRFLGNKHSDKFARDNSFLDIQTYLFDTYLPCKKITANGDCLLIGKGVKQTFSREEISILRSYFIGTDLQFCEEGLFFKKLLYNKQLYTIESYKEDAKRTNCYILTNDQRLFIIESLVNVQLLNENNSVSTLLVVRRLRFNVEMGVNSKCQMITVYKESSRLRVIEPILIFSKCILLRPRPHLTMSTLANLFERD